MIGQLKYPAEAEKMQKVDNGRGGFKEVAVPIGTFWLSQYRVTQREVLQYQQAGLTVENKFIARYDPIIDENVRFVLNGVRYRVVFTENPVDPTDYMEIYTEVDQIGE